MNAKKKGLLIGTVIGAILGTGTAYLLMAAPTPLDDGEEPKPITGADLIGLTGALALAIRKLDDLRRRV